MTAFGAKFKECDVTDDEHDFAAKWMKRWWDVNVLSESALPHSMSQLLLMRRNELKQNRCSQVYV